MLAAVVVVQVADQVVLVVQVEEDQLAEAVTARREQLIQVVAVVDVLVAHLMAAQAAQALSLSATHQLHKERQAVR
jgi:hypothetical protein